MRLDVVARVIVLGILNDTYLGCITRGDDNRQALPIEIPHDDTLAKCINSIRWI